MCMLCVSMPGATPSEEGLRNSCDNNPDGFGWSMIARGKILSGKSMDAEVAIEQFLSSRAKYPDGPALFHARYATHGTMTLDNCHPFTVAGDSRTVMGHNGILDVKIPKKDSRSDSRFFADNVFPKAGGVLLLDDELAMQELETFCAGSKLAFLTVDPRMRRQLYIVNEHLGKWDNGTWWSNDGYKLSYKKLKVSKWWKLDEHKDDDEYYEDLALSRGERRDLDLATGAFIDCVMCGDNVTKSDDWICPSCGCCSLCDMDWSQCNCEVDDDLSYEDFYCIDCGNDYYQCVCDTVAKYQAACVQLDEGGWPV